MKLKRFKIKFYLSLLLNRIDFEYLNFNYEQHQAYWSKKESVIPRINSVAGECAVNTSGRVLF